MADPLDSLDAPPPKPRTKLTCEFCLCELATGGDYFKLSEKAKEYRGLEERLAAAQAEISDAQQKLSAAIRERDEARAALQGAKQPVGSSSSDLFD